MLAQLACCSYNQPQSHRSKSPMLDSTKKKKVMSCGELILQRLKLENLLISLNQTRFDLIDNKETILVLEIPQWVKNSIAPL